MLRVTIELVPFGNEDEKRKIGEMVIANDMTGDPYNGNYQALIASDDWSNAPESYIKLEGHNRRSSVWDLVSELLNKRLFKHEKDEKTYEKLKEKLYDN
jgi:hypothetical protein